MDGLREKLPEFFSAQARASPTRLPIRQVLKELVAIPAFTKVFLSTNLGCLCYFEKVEKPWAQHHYGKTFSASQSLDGGRLSRERKPAYAPRFYAAEKASKTSDYGAVSLEGSTGLLAEATCPMETRHRHAA